MEKSYIIIDKWRCIFLLFIDFSISRFIEFFTLMEGNSWNILVTPVQF